jgi:hypothetical protein
MQPRPESDLYPPVKQFLERQGFCVRAEVGQCDAVATRDGDLVVVELKSAFNLALVFQGIDRQTVTENVYLAVEAPRRHHGGSRWNDVQRLCGRLGLGLLAVHFYSERAPLVELVREPAQSAPRRNRRRQALLVDEFQNRSGDFNVGGSSRRRPVVTAYREEALRVARHLHVHGPSRVCDLRTVTGVAKAGSITQRNFYGWFERVKHGVYELTAAGREALVLYEDVLGSIGMAEDGGGEAAAVATQGK